MVSVLLAVIELIATCAESSLLLVFILLVVFWIPVVLSALLSSSESAVVTFVTVFELVVLAEDDAELVVIAVFVLVSVFVVEWVAWISFDIVSAVIVLSSVSIALTELINKMVAHIKIIVPK